MELINKKIKINNTLILLFVTLVIIVFFSILSKVLGSNFLTLSNFKTLLRSMVVFGVIALGLTPLLIARGLDLSFGASLSLSSVIVALIYTNIGVNLWVSLLTGVLICVVIGFLNGILIVRFKLIPLLLTIGMMFILESFALLVATIGRPETGSGGGTGVITVGMLTEELYWFATKSFLAIPLLSWVLIVLIFIYWFVMDFTKIGARIKAIGGNPEVATLFGIKTNKIMILLYLFMGLSTGIATIMVLSVSGVGSPFLGQNMPLKTLSAVLIGGITLTGGSGNVWGTVLGTIIMTVLYNGLATLNVGSNYITVIQGITLILIVAAYAIRDRNKFSSQ